MTVHLTVFEPLNTVVITFYYRRFDKWSRGKEGSNRFEEWGHSEYGRWK